MSDCVHECWVCALCTCEKNEIESDRGIEGGEGRSGAFYEEAPCRMVLRVFFFATDSE